AAVELGRIMQTQRSLRLIEHRIPGRSLWIDLTKWRQVVQHPERTAVRGYDKVVILDHKVVNWRNGKVQLQRLPVGAVIERYEHTGLGAGIEQALLPGIDPNSSDISAFRNPVNNKA